MTRILRPWVAGLLILAAASAAAPLPTDLPPDMLRDFEAERVEGEFTDTRAAAYRLVRASPPRLAASLARIEALLKMVLRDRSLTSGRRNVLVQTLEWDLEEVRRIARERGDSSELAAPRFSYRDIKWLPPCGGKSGITAKDADPDKDFKRSAERRSGGVKMTAVEEAIMAGLDKQHEVDFERTPFLDVIGHLRKVTDLPIGVDKRAQDEISVTIDTAVTLTGKMSLRSILKRFVSGRDLVYVIKDEAILITSQARANTMTVTRSYHFGDLATRMGVHPKSITSRAVLLEQAKMIVLAIQRAVDPYSWKANDPDAVGRIMFDPETDCFIIKQSAEFHFKNFGR